MIHIYQLINSTLNYTLSSSVSHITLGFVLHELSWAKETEHSMKIMTVRT